MSSSKFGKTRKNAKTPHVCITQPPYVLPDPGPPTPPWPLSPTWLDYTFHDDNGIIPDLTLANLEIPPNGENVWQYDYNDGLVFRQIIISYWPETSWIDITIMHGDNEGNYYYDADSLSPVPPAIPWAQIVFDEPCYIPSCHHSGVLKTQAGLPPT